MFGDHLGEWIQLLAESNTPFLNDISVTPPHRLLHFGIVRVGGTPQKLSRSNALFLLSRLPEPAPGSASGEYGDAGQERPGPARRDGRLLAVGECERFREECASIHGGHGCVGSVLCLGIGIVVTSPRSAWASSGRVKPENNKVTEISTRQHNLRFWK